MALTIENATFGYDIRNVDDALTEIKRGVITEAVETMNKSMDKLKGWVDSAWVGKSAELFKKNMEKDKEMIANQLTQSYNALENVILTQLSTRIAEADQNLVKARKE